METHEKRRRNARGFSLIELILSMGIGLVVMAGAVQIFQQGIDGMHTLGQRAEVQQNARVGINLIARDLSVAGTGIPQGGIALPTGGAAVNPRFACDTTTCFVTSNAFPDDRLYAIVPGDGLGPTVNGAMTDVVVVTYDDANYALDQLALVNVTNNQIRVDGATNPPINDPQVGIRAGDVIEVYNGNGSAAAVVTSVSSPNINFATDPLNFNQTGAPAGNLAAILNPPVETRAKRIYVISYFVEDPPGPDGRRRLMRQVNAHPPTPIAENVENLQFTYDIFDDAAGVVTANLNAPNNLATPPTNRSNQIRKVSVSISNRSPQRGLAGGTFESISLTTSATPRNLSFRDRYE
jgi:type IV pilus assembly protein PilW